MQSITNYQAHVLFNHACRSGNLEIVEELSNKVTPEVFSTVEAARGGHLPILKYLESKGCEWDTRTSAAAAASGSIEVLEYLFGKCEFNANAFSEASRKGHLHVVKWLHKHNVNSDQRVCALASREGHLDVLKWAIQKQYKLDKNECSMFAKNEAVTELILST